MKTHLLILSALLIFSNVLFAKVETNKFEKSTAFFSESTVYQPLYIESFIYNAKAFGDSFDQALLNADSIPVSKTTFEYDDSKITGFTKLWLDEDWTYESKSILYFKNETMIDSSVAFQYDTVNNQWKKVALMEYKWENGLQTEYIMSAADSLTGEMKAYIKTVTAYNADKKPTIERMSYYDDESSAWVEMSTETYTYIDATHTAVVNKTMIPGTTMTLPSDSTLQTYNSSGVLIDEVDYSWNMFGSNWSKTMKQTYFFNSKGLEYLCNSYSWDASQTNWTMTGKDSTVYENKDKALVDFAFETTSAGQLLLHEKTFFQYQWGAGNETIEQLDNFIKVFPNPTSDRATIRVNNPIAASVMVIDLSGRVVLREPITSAETIISLGGFKTGNYIVQVKNNNKTNTQILMVK